MSVSSTHKLNLFPLGTAGKVRYFDISLVLYQRYHWIYDSFDNAYYNKNDVL
jgi:hypothetical protein